MKPPLRILWRLVVVIVSVLPIHLASAACPVRNHDGANVNWDTDANWGVRVAPAYDGSAVIGVCENNHLILKVAVPRDIGLMAFRNMARDLK